MPSRIEWISDTAALEDCLGRVGSGPVALDSEADSLHHYPEKVCLVQLSFDETDYLIDPLAGADLTALGPLLEDSSIRKLVHGGDYDVRILGRDHGLRFRSTFDTMIAARLTGETSFGLSALLRTRFEVELDKRFQRADWSMRPLSDEMMQYAALDTRHLERLTSGLEDELERLGRASWAAEEFERLEAVRWTPREPEVFRRVKGSTALDRQGLGILRELVEMREQEARRMDRPPFRVLRDEQLLEVTKACPDDPRAVARIERLPESWRRGTRARGLFEAVERARALSEEDLPEIRRGLRKRRSERFEKDLKTIRQARDEIATGLGLESSLVAPRALLEDLIERTHAGAPIDESPDLRRWQQRLLEPSLALLRL